MKRIGVWQTAFLGDLVLTLPLMTTLRKAFPRAEIQVVVRKGLAPVLAGHANDFELLEFDKRGAQKGLAAAWTFGRSMRGVDAWVSAHASLRSAVVAKAVGAPQSVGYDHPLWNKLAYTNVIPRFFGQGEETWRIARLAQPVLDAAGISQPLDDWPELRPEPQALENAGTLWADLGLRHPVIGLHPGTLWPTKRWPAPYFAEILDRAAAQGVKVLLFAGPGEEAMADEVLSASRRGHEGLRNNAVINLAGKLRIPDLLAHIWKLSAYVANDSGPMHAAWAMRTPVVALIGPTGGIGFDPRGETSAVAAIPPNELTCRPCGTHGAKTCKLSHHACMQRLTPDRVWPLVARALEMNRGR